MQWIRKLVILFCLVVTGVVLAESQEEVAYEFKGVHFLASYCECDEAALTDVEGMAQAMQKAVEASGATILSSSSWVFPPCGLTMVFLLSESHASIHTYPEHKACFIDLFTCGNSCSAEKFDAVMRAYLSPKGGHQRTLVRHENLDQ